MAVNYSNCCICGRRSRTQLACSFDRRIRPCAFPVARRVMYALTRMSLGHATNAICDSPSLFLPSFQISEAHFVLRHSYVHHASFHSALIFLLCVVEGYSSTFRDYFMIYYSFIIRFLQKPTIDMFKEF